MFCFSLIYFHDFPEIVWMVGNLLFFVYCFLDGVRFIVEVQKPFRTFGIYISIFTQPIWFILLFLFFNFYWNIHTLTNPIIDFIRSIMNNIANVKVISVLTWALCVYYMIYYPTYLYLLQFIRKDNLNTAIKTTK